MQRQALAHQLQRVLSQEWLRNWEGWDEWKKKTQQRNAGSMELDDDSFAEELVKRILKISMDQTVIDYPSDEQRKKICCCRTIWK